MWLPPGFALRGAWRSAYPARMRMPRPLCRRLTALLVATAAAPAGAAPSVFVLNSNDATMAVIDYASHRVTATLPLLREPHHLVLSPDHASLVVGDTRGNALFFLDPRTGAQQRRVVVSDPYQLLYSPDGKYLTTAGNARNQIDILDGRTLEVLHRVPGKSIPSHIAYTPDSRVVFVTLQGSDRMIAIRTADGRVLWNEKVGDTPAGVIWNRGRLLVGIMGAAHVAVVDPATGHVARVVKTGKGAHTLFFNRDGSKIYATNRVEGTISVIDPVSLAVERSYRVPGGPDDLEFAPDGRIWATLRFAQSVAILDPNTGAVERIAVGRSPHGIWMNTHDGLSP